MGKNILIIGSLIFIVYIVRTSLFSEKEIVIPVSNYDEKIQVVNKTDAVQTEIKGNINENKNQLTDKPKNLNHYSFYEASSNCGFSQELFDQENSELDLQKLNIDDFERLNYAIQECNEWFARLQNLTVEELKQLEVDVKKKKKLLTKLVKYKYDKGTLNLARKEVLNDDPDIKFIALEYLLKFDFDFQKQVAQEMNVSQINYLTTDALTFNLLYLCHHGYDCSPQSRIMQDTCKRDENSCGMSFPVWLRSGQVTLNLYDDMMRAIVVIDKVLDSDWFLEHPLNI